MVEHLATKLGITRKTSPVEHEVERYAVDKGFVEVRHKLFLPQKIQESELDLASAQIHITGWNIPEDTKAYARYGQALANESGQQTLVVDTLVHGLKGNTLTHESATIGSSLVKRGIKKVSLSGLSRGGTEAIDLAYYLQENSDIQVEGLTIINSVGLYNQSFQDRLFGMGKDLARTGLGIHLHFFDSDGLENYANTQKLLLDSLARQAQKAKDAKRHFIQEIRSELIPTGEINPHTHKLQCPVVIFTTAKEPVSDPRRYIRNNDRKKGEPEWLPYDKREPHLKNSLFSSSPHVRMLVAREDPYHLGIIFRPETYAKAQIGMHRRIQQSTPDKKGSKRTKNSTTYSISA